MLFLFVFRKMMKHDTRICINISGLRFETYLSTLERYPNTLLGSPKTRDLHYDKKSHEFFFHRNREAFDAILFFYQSYGILHRPNNVSEKAFYQELKYFKIIPLNSKYSYCEKAKLFLSEEHHLCPPPHWRHRLGRLFLCPASSNAAKIIALVNLLLVVLSIVISCVETIAHLKHKIYFGYINHICYAYFTVDYIIRFTIVKNIGPFFFSFLSITDVLALASFYTQFLLESYHATQTILSIVYVFKIVRLTRLLRLTRFSLGMRALLFTLKSSWPELQTHIIVALLINIFFASFSYFFEVGHPGHLIKSIPESMWWSINTFTTVGKQSCEICHYEYLLDLPIYDFRCNLKVTS